MWPFKKKPEQPAPASEPTPPAPLALVVPPELAAYEKEAKRTGFEPCALRQLWLEERLVELGVTQQFRLKEVEQYLREMAAHRKTEQFWCCLRDSDRTNALGIRGSGVVYHEIVPAEWLRIVRELQATLPWARFVVSNLNKGTGETVFIAAEDWESAVVVFGAWVWKKDNFGKVGLP